MVEADVAEHRDRRAVKRDRSVALVDLAHEQVGIADQRRGKGRLRRNEILHHRAVHHRRALAGGIEHPADHPGDGRLARGAADRDADRRGVEQLSEELRAGEVGQAELARADDIEDGRFDRRRGDQRRALAQTAAILREQFNAEPFQIVEFGRKSAGVERPVRTGHVGAGRAHDRGERQHPAPADAAEMIG